MRQLTSVDAQFLALESARQSGHVGGLAILDPSTRPDGKLTLEAVHDLIAERLPLLPPLRWRLAEVPFGLDYPYWVDDPRLRPRLPRARAGAVAAGQRGEARRAGGAHRGAAARPLAPALGGVPDPRSRSRSRGDAHEDPPLARGRPVRGRDHGRAARPDGRGARGARAARRQPGRRPVRARDARARAARACRATRCGSCARCRRRCPTSTRRPSARCPARASRRAWRAGSVTPSAAPRAACSSARASRRRARASTGASRRTGASSSGGSRSRPSSG